MSLLSRLPLRTQLLLATIAVSFALTAASLWFVRQSIAREVERQTGFAVRGSVEAFNKIQQQQQAELSTTAAMLSELPTLKAVLTTQDAATVEDASGQFLELSGADVIVFGDASGRLLGVRSTGHALSRDGAERLIAESVAGRQPTGWWQSGDELLRYVVRPIVIGAGPVSRTVGVMVLARRITDAVAQDIARVSGTEVALLSGPAIVAATLRGTQRAELATLLQQNNRGAREISLGAHPYALSEVGMETAPGRQIDAILLFPLDQTYTWLGRLTRIIIVLGLLAVAASIVLATVLARALTRPLENLVAGAQALASGNYFYSIEPRGSAELAELGTAFISMREQLLDSQRRQLQAERMAALGRAASSISHDLRHHLAALVANAEFLRDAAELGCNRDEIYHEVQQATEQMTGLIDSLMEVARDRSALVRAPTDLAQVVGAAVKSVRSRPEFRDATIEVEGPPSRAVVDAHKLQRVFSNLLVNACEATPPGSRRIRVSIAAAGEELQCRISDNGAGIPVSIRATLFEPFVSAGKNNGTGLGLAIAKKIVVDHDGAIDVERTSAEGTTFLIRLPQHPAEQPAGSAHSTARS